LNPALEEVMLRRLADRNRRFEVTCCAQLQVSNEYKGLTIETEYFKNKKKKVIPVKIGATGTISKSLRQYLSNITGKHEIQKL
jgi:deoxyadenosine/deoxycytidine kinase